MLALEILLLVAGFVLLVKGADWFVDGSAAIAAKCRVPAFVIGLTVVAFGTSAPELAVSITSAVQHSTDIAVGNVLGSNIANILLILGISALIHELPVEKKSLKVDLPVLLFCSALFIGLGAWGNALNWWDGIILLAVFIGYMTYVFFGAKKEHAAMLQRGETPASEEQPAKGKLGAWYQGMLKKTWFIIVLALAGLGMVAGGGTLLVNSAKWIATYFGVSERIVGLTVVAIGTSLPELVTSVMAAKKGETDIAVGNIIGSNIFNILIVAGIASLFYPLAFTLSENLLDACVALFAAALLFAFLFLHKEHKLNKAAGVLFTACFLAYYITLFLV